MPQHINMVGIDCGSAGCVAVVFLLLVRLERNVFSPEFFSVTNVEALNGSSSGLFIGTCDKQPIPPGNRGRVPDSRQVYRPVVIFVGPFDGNCRGGADA